MWFKGVVSGCMFFLSLHLCSNVFEGYGVPSLISLSLSPPLSLPFSPSLPPFLPLSPSLPPPLSLLLPSLLSFLVAMAELLFESYGVPSLSFGIDGLYSLYHAQGNDDNDYHKGLVWDIVRVF